MMISPDYDSFARAYEAGQPQIVSSWDLPRLAPFLREPQTILVAEVVEIRSSKLRDSASASRRVDQEADNCSVSQSDDVRCVDAPQ